MEGLAGRVRVAARVMGPEKMSLSAIAARIQRKEPR